MKRIVTAIVILGSIALLAQFAWISKNLSEKEDCDAAITKQASETMTGKNTLKKTPEACEKYFSHAKTTRQIISPPTQPTQPQPAASN